MTPELRAIADRFIYEQATLKHITALAPEEAMLRPIPGGDWNVGQLLGHLGASMNAYAGVVREWLLGEPALDGYNPDEMNAETASRFLSATRLDVTQELGRGLVNLFAALWAIPDARLSEPMGRQRALETLQLFGGHCLRHAIALVDALPEVRMDPLVLNWLLAAEFEDEGSRAWQNALLAEAQEYIASHPEDEEDEE